MGRLALNVDAKTLRGETIQKFKIIHAGEEIIVSLYKNLSTGLLKVNFDGPRSFVIHRFIENLVLGSEQRTDDSSGT